MEPTFICGIDKKVFESLVKEIPSFGLTVVRNLSRRIDQLTGKLGKVTETSTEEKLYRVLVNVAKRIGYQTKRGWSIHLHLSHKEIGFLAGIHRISVTRALKKLDLKGKIFQKNNTLFLPNIILT